MEQSSTAYLFEQCFPNGIYLDTRQSYRKVLVRYAQAVPVIGIAYPQGFSSSLLARTRLTFRSPMFEKPQKSRAEGLQQEVFGGVQMLAVHQD